MFDQTAFIPVFDPCILLVSFFLLSRPLLAAINISLRSEVDAVRTSIPLSCFQNNKVVLVQDYDK